jgi:hypothetical protein
MTRSAGDPLDAFVAQLKGSLPVPPAGSLFALPAFARRYKARTIHSACGLKRMSASFFVDLTARLASGGIYTDRLLTAPGLRNDDWVRFARVPFPPACVLVEREQLLHELLRGAIGRYGPLKDLRLIGEQHTLHTGRRIDLLCEEDRRDGRGALVVIELKRSSDERAIEQTVSYIRDLRQEPLAAGRTVRGLIIVGKDDDAGTQIAKTLKDYDIRWCRYGISLEDLP